MAKLELGLSRLAERAREGALVEREKSELLLSSGWSWSLWRKMGISPELARDARASRLVLADGEGLGGVGGGVLLSSNSDFDSDSDSKESMFCLVRRSRNGVLNLIMICGVGWGR